MKPTYILFLIPGIAAFLALMSFQNCSNRGDISSLGKSTLNRGLSSTQNSALEDSPDDELGPDDPGPIDPGGDISPADENAGNGLQGGFYCGALFNVSTLGAVRNAEVKKLRAKYNLPSLHFIGTRPGNISKFTLASVNGTIVKREAIPACKILVMDHLRNVCSGYVPKIFLKTRAEVTGSIVVKGTMLNGKLIGSSGDQYQAGLRVAFATRGKNVLPPIDCDQLESAEEYIDQLITEENIIQ